MSAILGTPATDEPTPVYYTAYIAIIHLHYHLFYMFTILFMCCPAPRPSINTAKRKSIAEGPV
jgi:hypothetical protein